MKTDMILTLKNMQEGFNMESYSLDQWGVTTSTDEMKKPLIVSDAHADYLYEQSYDRQVEKHYNMLIEAKLAEEKEEQAKLIQQHQEYVNRNYVRVGGN